MNFPDFFFAADEEWKPLRKVFNHSFIPSMLQICIPNFVLYSDKLVQKLSKYLDGTDFDLLHYISMATVDMLLESTYGVEKSEEKKEEIYPKVIKAVDQ